MIPSHRTAAVLFLLLAAAPAWAGSAGVAPAAPCARRDTHALLRATLGELRAQAAADPALAGRLSGSLDALSSALAARDAAAAAGVCDLGGLDAFIVERLAAVEAALSGTPPPPAAEDSGAGEVPPPATTVPAEDGGVEAGSSAQPRGPAVVDTVLGSAERLARILRDMGLRLGHGGAGPEGASSADPPPGFDTDEPAVGPPAGDDEDPTAAPGAGQAPPSGAPPIDGEAARRRRGGRRAAERFTRPALPSRPPLAEVSVALFGARGERIQAARVLLDGALLPRGGDGTWGRRVSPGTHQLSVSARGYAPQSLTIAVHPGREKRLTLRLLRAPSLPPFRGSLIRRSR